MSLTVNNAMSLIWPRLTMSLLLLLILHPSPNVGRVAGGIYPAVPLAVRSPYLNCWLHNNDNVSISGQTWPTTFNSSQILGWSVLIRIDDLTYSFLGDVDPNLVNGTVKLNSTYFSIGPTNTQLEGNAGPMQVILRFINPIEPGDWVKQSIPFSYMSFTAKSLDNATHHVQVYSDVSGEWNSGDRTQQILWSPTVSTKAVFHSVGLQKPEIATEILDQAEWGTLYYAMKNGVNVTYQAASDVDSRGNFTRNGKLISQSLSKLDLISNRSTVFAISRDLGPIQATQDPVVWAIGYTTDVAINYTDLSGGAPTSRNPYYKIKYSNDTDLIVDFLNDFSNASSRSNKVNSQTISDSDSIHVGLGQMLFIAIAEVYGSMQLTIGTDAYENFNESDVMMFMKNIGGVKKNRVNAVETLYAAFPALMYLDPSLGAPLLEPLFRLQASRNYTIGYAAADLGTNYPNVAGSNSKHNQGVEQTGNMLIMTYAYARASGNGSLISKYYSVLASWANYLSASTMFIGNQSSADNLTVNNQTNLAIKGIIAIGAMSKMSSVVNRIEDATKYSSAATRLYAQWESLALGSDQHLLAKYGQSNSESWTLGYNLFADVWLGLNLVGQPVYYEHSNFIYTVLSNPNISNFGLPVDNAHTNVTVSSWSLFAAAMTNDERLRSELITKVSNHFADTTIPASVFPVYYDSADGTLLQGVASPAQGAVFAPLARNAPAKSINPDRPPIETNPASHRKGNRNVGAIASVTGVIGGVAAFLAVATFVQRRRRPAGPGRIPISDSGSYEEAQAPEILGQQQQLVTEEPGEEMIPLHHLSSASPIAFPLPAPGTPALATLSGKEIARVRAEGLDSEQSPGRDPGVSSSDVLQSTSPPDAVTESREVPNDHQRLHSEIENLRREVERLHMEGLVFESPPSYVTGEGSEGNG